MNVISKSVTINPNGTEPLTPEQVWRGLVMKAENAALFVPGMESCEVLERTADGLIREAVYRGQRIRERVTFDPPREVFFEQIDPDGGGWVRNTLSEDGSTLTFTFAVQAAVSEQVEADYVQAIQATLQRVREMVRSGEV